MADVSDVLTASYHQDDAKANLRQIIAQAHDTVP
jgi:hypothetical protein